MLPDLHEREGRRTILDMIEGRNTPTNPAAPDPRGLSETGALQCRFPLSGAGATMRFCAAAVEPDVWLPGISGRCYCAFHRRLARRPRAMKAVA